MPEKKHAPAGRKKRVPLSRQRVIVAAIDVADTKGPDGITMRAIAARLGVEAMSLYNHVKSRDDILDGMVDAAFAEIDFPAVGSDWKLAMTTRATSARAVLKRHPWAVGMMDSRRQPGPETLRHHDAVIGALRTAGFSVRMCAHAVSVIDSYIYGFVLQELSLPFDESAGADVVAADIMNNFPVDAYPHLAELTREHVLKPGYDYGDEFSYGLALVLGALQPDELT